MSTGSYTRQPSSAHLDPFGLEPLDAASGPAVQLSPHAQRAMAHAIVQRALAAQAQVHRIHAAPGKAPTARRNFLAAFASRGPWQMAAAIALVASLGGSALAAVAVYVVDRVQTNTVVEVAKPVVPPARRRPAAAPAAKAPEAVQPDAEAAIEVPDIAILPVAPSRPSKRAPAAPSATEPSLAEHLLAKANELRARRSWRKAEHAYMRVTTAAPASDEAYAALIAAAALRVEQLGQPAAALPLYKQALKARPTGSLAEEARYGMAESYRALGRAADERNALQQFLAHHPRSLLRTTVQSRLQTLGGTAP